MGESLSDDGVGVQRQVWAVLLDGTERQAEDRLFTQLDCRARCGERGERPSGVVVRHLLLRRPKRIRNSFSSGKVSSSLKSASRSMTAVSNACSRSPKRWGAAKEVEYR